MNFYDVNSRQDSRGNDYFARKRLTMPRTSPMNHLNAAKRKNFGVPLNTHSNPATRGFDAKKLYRDRLNTLNATKNRKKLDFRPVNEEIYNRRRDDTPPPVISEN